MSAQSDSRQKDLIRDRFTRTAEFFSNFVLEHRVREAERLARLVRAGTNDRAVDLACGPGTLALKFARQVRWICGLDLTPAMLARAKRSAAEEGIANAAFAFGDVNAVPLPDGSLDIAVTSYSLHHMPDAARVVGEMARVVRRGGRVGVLDIFVPEDPRIAELNNRIERTRDPSHTRTLAKNEFEAIFAQLGLRMLGSEVEAHPRSFDHWMRTAGWERADTPYIETRRLMEASMPDDSANYHPRFAPPDPARSGEEPDIDMVNTALFIAGQKM